MPTNTYRITFFKNNSNKRWNTLVNASCEGDAAANLIKTLKGSLTGEVKSIIKIEKVK